MVSPRPDRGAQSLAASGTSRRCGWRRPGRASEIRPAAARAGAAGRRGRCCAAAGPLRPRSASPARSRGRRAPLSPRSRSLDRPPRADAGLEAALDPDRVADPGDDPLVEQRVAELAPGPARRRRRAAARRVEARRQGSGPSRIRRGSLRSSRLAASARSVGPPNCDGLARLVEQHQPRRPARRAIAVGGDRRPAPVHPEVAVQDEVRRRSAAAGSCRAPRRARRVRPRELGHPSLQAPSAGSAPRRADVRCPRAPRPAARRRGGSCRPQARRPPRRYAEATRRRGWREKPASISVVLEARADHGLAVDALDRRARDQSLARGLGELASARPAPRPRARRAAATPRPPRSTKSSGSPSRSST